MPSPEVSPFAMTVSTGPTESTELLARIPDFEQALAYYRRHLAPETAIDLSVAENVLVYQDSMQKMVFDHTALLPESYIHYMSAYGTPDLRNEVAALLSKAFGGTVEAGDVFGTGGVGSALECLAFALQDPPKPGRPARRRWWRGTPSCCRRRTGRGSTGRSSSGRS